MSQRDEELWGRKITHPSYAMASVSRVSGQTRLFSVEHPQDHYMALRINLAELNRHDTYDHHFPREEIVEVYMSETQWARMIASPNTCGVACTLKHIQGARIPEPPEEAPAETPMREGVKKRARSAASKIDEAWDMLEALLKPGGAVKKGDLQGLRDALYKARQELGSNIPYLVESAEEAIQNSVEKSKAELEAYRDHVMLQLATRALGAHIAAGGVLPPELEHMRVQLAPQLEDRNAVDS